MRVIVNDDKEIGKIENTYTKILGPLIEKNYIVVEAYAENIPNKL